MVDERDRLRRLRQIGAEANTPAPEIPVGVGGSLGLEDLRGQSAAVPKASTNVTEPVDLTEEDDDTIVKPKLLSIYTDPDTGDIIDVYDNGDEVIRKKGTIKADRQVAADATAAERLAERVSAYDILYSEFKDLGLESLVSDIKESIMNSQSKSERTLALRSSKAYQTRFAGNAKRVANGFAAIDEATYLELEDKYQQIAQDYGLPAKYYSRGQLGVQQYFEDAIAKNIDPVTFKERVMEGQKLLNANKLILDTARAFYPELNDGDFLDFVLNPSNALSDIKRKINAAEIGGAALAQGLTTGMKALENLQTGFSNVTGAAMGAEELASLGVTKEQARQGFQQVAEVAPRGEFLSSISGGEDYGRLQAEQEAFQGLASAKRARVSLTQQEQARFGGSSGTSKASLTSQRSGLI
jgi:hypothetical protein